MYNREIEVLNMIVQIPNSIQPIQGLPVVTTIADSVKTPEGQMIGYPQQHQRYLLPQDMSPELLNALNTSLATIGYKLVQTGEPAPLEPEEQ